MRNDDITKAVYEGNGVTTRWSIPFDYFAESEIHVLLTVTVAGLEQETEVESDSFTIDGDAKEIVYPNSAGEEPVPAGTKLTVYRSTDTLQQADYTNQGAMWPETLEGSLDKIHQVLQEHSEGLARSFTVSMSSNKTPKEYADELIAGSIAAVEAASAAAQSETNAATSATASAGSAAASLASQQAAATSETNAAASASAAAQSATALETAVTTATTKAAEALASQQAASASESSAAASATAAGNSATAAYNSEVAAEAAESRISDRWGLRKKNTTYSADDMAYHVDLPTGWYLECTTGGITSASDLVITSPAIGDTVVDGTVTWTIRKMGSGSGGDGFAIGDIKQIAHNGTIQDGWLLCDGRAVSRTMFPDLFSAIGTTYGAGDGSTTFNVPDYNTAERFCQGSTVAGTVKTAGLPNIEGYIQSSGVSIGNNGSANSSHSGALKGENYDLKSAGGVSQNAYYMSKISLDASLSNPIYGNSTTVQPPALTARYIIKAYDGVTPTPSEADISEMLTELTNKADRRLSNLDTANLACHVVVDSYYDDTTGDWWHKYDNGWIEQGGVATGGSYNAPATINLLKPMVNKNYILVGNCYAASAYSQFWSVYFGDITTTSFKAVTSENGATPKQYPFKWFVCGMGANE